MSIQKFLKTAIIALIPGMFIRRLGKIEYDLNNGTRQKRQRIFIALGVGALCLIAGCALGGFIGFAILTPALGPVSQGAMIATALLSVLSVGLVSMELGFLSAKHSLRFLSWLKYHKDSNVVNPKNPEKYAEHHISINPSDSFKMEQNDAQNAMRKLYFEKQKIKNHPEGYFGELSAEQEEKRKAINYAVKVLRYDSVATLFKPTSSLSSKTNNFLKSWWAVSNPTFTNEDLNRMNDTIAEKMDQDHFKNNGITKQQQEFLRASILK